MRKSIFMSMLLLVVGINCFFWGRYESTKYRDIRRSLRVKKNVEDIYDKLGLLILFFDFVRDSNISKNELKNSRKLALLEEWFQTQLPRQLKELKMNNRSVSDPAVLQMFDDCIERVKLYRKKCM